MEKSDVSQPIRVILDGHNYVLWAHAIHSFLKGQKLWHYVIGDIVKHVDNKDELDEKFADRRKDWEKRNHQIMT